MMTITDTIIIAFITIAIITIITIAIITISTKTHTDAHNGCEANSRFHCTIWVSDLLSPASNYIPILQNRILQLSTSCPWEIMRSCLGGCAKDKVQTMISTDVKILAGCHPTPATCLQVPSGYNSTSLQIEHARAGSGALEFTTVWRANLCLTTPPTQLGRGLSDGGCAEILASCRWAGCQRFMVIQGYWRWAVQQGVYFWETLG